MSIIVYRMQCLECQRGFNVDNFSIRRGHLVVNHKKGCPFCKSKKLKGIGLSGGIFGVESKE